MTLRRKFVNPILVNKTCTKCGNSYPRNTNYFYVKKHPSFKDRVSYYSHCISCDYKRLAANRKKFREKQKKQDLIYKKSERGFFMGMWQGVKNSRHGNEFKNFEEFFNCWREQQKTYGNKCPYLGIEMTRNVGHNKNRHGVKTKTCKTNISKDRINSFLPYSPKNIMFCSWRANDMKGSVTPMIAKRYLGFFKERFGDNYEME